MKREGMIDKHCTKLGETVVFPMRARARARAPTLSRSARTALPRPQPSPQPAPCSTQCRCGCSTPATASAAAPATAPSGASSSCTSERGGCRTQGFGHCGFSKVQGFGGHVRDSRRSSIQAIWGRTHYSASTSPARKQVFFPRFTSSAAAASNCLP